MAETSTTKLSDRLSDLAQRAKAAEDAFEAARAEGKQKLAARIDSARSSVEQLKQTIQQDASSSSAQAKEQWQDLQSRVSKRVEKIKADFSADRAVVRADFAEDEAAAAIDDASSAVEYARYAVLNAVSARLDANSTSSP